MALHNGLLVHGPTHWAAAVRDGAGAIQVASGRKPKLKLPVEKVPGARGVVKLAEAMLVIPLVKRALPATKLPFQNASVLGAVVGTTGVAALLRRSLGGTVGGEAAVAAVSLLPSLVALRSGDLAAYHGVEHKAIAAYEQDAPDARDAAKEHDRCGSHLMAPLLTANLAGTVLLRRLVDKPRPVHGAALQLASLGAAVEVFAWSERNAGTPVAKALQRPGHELQRVLGTREPSEAQLEVGRAALAEILRVEEAAPTPA
jgi:uncharacterized protein YqhQ